MPSPIVLLHHEQLRLIKKQISILIVIQNQLSYHHPIIVFLIAAMSADIAARSATFSTPLP